MKNISAYIFICLFCFSGFGSLPNPSDSLIKFTGKVVDEEGAPILFAHVINMGDYKGTITDTLGVFVLAMDKYDTLRITCIGYEDFFFCLPFFIAGGQHASKIVLQNKIYQIPELTKYASGSYKKFKRDFIDLKLPERKINPAAFEGLPENKRKKEEYRMPPVGSPISLIYRWTSKEGRSIRKLSEFTDEDKKNKIIDSVLKASKIKDITGLEGCELEKFIIFCTFIKRLTEKDDEYTVTSKIIECFEEYKLMLK